MPDIVLINHKNILRQAGHAVRLDDLKSIPTLTPYQTTHRPGPGSDRPILFFFRPACLLQASACRPIPCASASRTTLSFQENQSTASIDATMPSHDTPPSPATTKRPSLSERDSSNQSLSRPSPSADAHSTSHKGSAHKLHRAHVVGHNRVAHARNPSYGKNLNKLTKLTGLHGGGEGTMVTRQHIRSKSTTPSTSPQAQYVKRNSSHISLARTGSKVSVKKNSSVVSLKRNGSVKELEKTVNADVIPRVLRLPSPQSKQGPRSSAVKFSVGSEGQDEEWTGDSTSQSPETTRHSSIAQGQDSRAGQQPPSPAPEEPPDTLQPSLARTPPQSPPRPIRRPSDRSISHRSRILDADAITSRLLQRHPPHMVPPRLSSVSATATPTGGHSPRSFGHSQSSTLNGTPGMPHDGVSRFISGGGSSGGTSGENSHMASRILSTSSPPNGSLDQSKRARSTSHIAFRNNGAEEEDDEDYDEPRALGPRSRQHSTHSAFNTSQSSRTQQKLNLQRASSNMEPSQPYVAPPSLTQGVTSTSLQGPNSQISETTRLAKQYEQACLEYAVVRRYRNPLGEALKRVDDIPGIKDMREKRMQVERPKSRAVEKLGAGSAGDMGLSQSLREDRRSKTNGRGEGRVRFEIGSKDDSGISGQHDSNDDDDGDGGDGTDRLVRRIWESRNEASGD